MTRAVYCLLFVILSVAGKSAFAADNLDCQRDPNLRIKYAGYVPVDIEQFIKHFFPHSEYMNNLGMALYVKLKVVNHGFKKQVFTGFAAKEGFEIMAPYERIQMKHKNRNWKYALALVGDGFPPPDKLEILPGQAGEVLAAMNINDGEAEEFRKFRVVLGFANNICVVSDSFELNVKVTRSAINYP